MQCLKYIREYNLKKMAKMQTVNLWMEIFAYCYSIRKSTPLFKVYLIKYMIIYRT